MGQGLLVSYCLPEIRQPLHSIATRVLSSECILSESSDVPCTLESHAPQSLTVCLLACMYLSPHSVIGCLQGVFDVSMLNAASILASAEFDLHFDTSLVFCYANRIVQAPNEDLEGDYRCVELFKVPAHRSLKDVLLENCSTFELPQEPEERLQAETHANSRYLWHSVPSILHERSEWWGRS